jgi:putative transposase
MSRYKKMSQTIWFCEYHIVLCPKFRYWILEGKIGEEVEHSIRGQTQQMSCEVVGLNVQRDHVHLISLIPPKLSVSSYMGRTKGKSFDLEIDT